MIILEGLYHIPVIKSLKSIFFEKNRISSASLQKLLHQPLNMKYKSIHTFPVCGDFDVLLYCDSSIFHFSYVMGED